ncbi:hypothetical protein HLH34_00005 [Gluconacetobacter azotocaptans]|uniref:Uncharacterized protein n=1 Tax=Gluconacetobacter azotocaptans TaxID=142834 RepID=A0A7W4PDG8_9PROT|nr:hypothetical protein [Gluconacetobacter azotocaptans]MBB2188354.1 hypothetical protein [Gluconacetobacter azotocaptans]GBQ31996.1 hypothetical protein AA13594_2244 [Gluconacetobacter azotocaptans DSM 13594]
MPDNQTTAPGHLSADELRRLKRELVGTCQAIDVALESLALDIPPDVAAKRGLARRVADEDEGDNDTTGEDSLTMGTWITGMVVGIALFALAYHFGVLDSIIATWTPAGHQGARARLEWG